MEGVFKASELCPSYVWKDSGICPERVRKEYWRCLEGLLMVSGRCLEVVWKVWKRCLEGVWNGRGLWSIKIFLSLSFSHGLVVIQNYPQINFFTMEEFLFANEWMQVCKYGMQVCNNTILQKNYQSFFTWVCNYATIHTILWSALL